MANFIKKNHTLGAAKGLRILFDDPNLTPDELYTSFMKLHDALVDYMKNSKNSASIKLLFEAELDSPVALEHCLCKVAKAFQAKNLFQNPKTKFYEPALFNDFSLSWRSKDFDNLWLSYRNLNTKFAFIISCSLSSSFSHRFASFIPSFQPLCVTYIALSFRFFYSFKRTTVSEFCLSLNTPTSSILPSSPSAYSGRKLQISAVGNLQ